MSVAVVLGAGGIVGAAWHAGAMTALAEAAFDARGADLIVGTSAGSGMAATLRLGVAPGDLLAAATGGQLSPEGAEYMAKAGPPPQFPVPELGGRIPRPANPLLAVRAAARGDLRPFAAMAGLLPKGTVPVSIVGDRIRRTHVRDWPDRPTWICAVRLSDGKRVVFGRDVEGIHIAAAVEASSAIPGFFEPVVHDGVTYVDGGVHSPTNADLVAGLGFDAVVVSSPMSATTEALRRRRWPAGRALHAATLRREVARIRSQGTPVLVLQPPAEVVDLAGANAMDPSRRSPVAEASHRTVAAHLRTGAHDDVLAVLRGATG